jgi:hypothetical protein
MADVGDIHPTIIASIIGGVAVITVGLVGKMLPIGFFIYEIRRNVRGTRRSAGWAIGQ